MPTQTYKYFQPDAVSLRAAYGGGSIQLFTDSQEVSPSTLTIRHIFRQLPFLDNGTGFLMEHGTASGVVWLKISDNLYPAISFLLSTAELATIQSSAPSGYVTSSTKAQLQPHPHRTNVVARGDSISDGLGTTSGNTEDVVWAQALESLEGKPLVYSESSNVALGEIYNLINMSIGGSSWANTNGAGSNTYPYREDLAYNQRTRTLPLSYGKGIFTYWLGTNDLAYDTGLSGADCWARASTRIAALRSEFPTLPIVVATTIKRSEITAFNNRVNDYNILIRDNYVSAGADILCDFEADVPEVNISTGNTLNTTYYTDGTHLTTAGHALLVPTAKTALQAAQALL